jgi:hypothetical protein
MESARIAEARPARALEIECARALVDRARAARVGTRQQRRAAARRFVRRHRRDPAYLRWVLRSAGASSALALALLGLASPAHATVPAFAPFTPDPLTGQDVGSQSTPALGDLDGDGDLDLVVGESGGALHYFANTGRMTSPAFAERTGAANPFGGLAAGAFPKPALADLDGDGDLDLVVGQDAGTFAYFRNTGGAMSPAFVPAVPNPLAGVDVGDRSAPALADLDGDGDLDLVAGNLGGTFAYLENTGTAKNPAFVVRTGAANPLAGGNVVSASTPALADLDRDGDFDLVAGRADGTFAVYENTGTRVSPLFVQRIANPLSSLDRGDRSAPALADLDGDGDHDLVAGSESGVFATYRDLRSSGPIPSFVGNLVYDPALGDLDGDGDLDLVSAGERYFHYFERTGTAINAFLERTGAASPFDNAPSQTLDPVNGLVECWHPALADVDGDGDLDLVAGRSNGEFCYFENTGTATRSAYVQRTGTANPLIGLQADADSARPALADLDADGDLDLAAGTDFAFTIAYFENTGSATHPGWVRVGPASPFSNIFCAYYCVPSFSDLDGDGDLDLVAGESGELAYYENTGTPASPVFLLRTGSSNPLPQNVSNNPSQALGDLDGDGDLDLVASDYHVGRLLSFENTGSSQSPAFLLRPAGDPVSGLNVLTYSTFADLDHDGDPDLILATTGYSSQFPFFENTGDAIAPSFVARTGAANPLPVVSIMSAKPAFADLDGDGDLDLLSGSTTGFGYSNPGPFFYCANTGNATAPSFAPAVQNPFGLTVGPNDSISKPAFGDLDGDGDFDLLAGVGIGKFNYYENTGTHASPAFVRRTGSANPFDGISFGSQATPTLGDFDLDGDLDLIIGSSVQPSGNSSSIRGFDYYRNTGTAIAPAFERLSGPPLRSPLDGQDGHGFVTAVDLDGDADFDFVDTTAFVYYAPEPGRALLFGAGALLLHLLSRWRRATRE